MLNCINISMPLSSVTSSFVNWISSANFIKTKPWVSTPAHQGLHKYFHFNSLNTWETCMLTMVSRQGNWCSERASGLFNTESEMKLESTPWLSDTMTHATPLYCGLPWQQTCFILKNPPPNKHLQISDDPETWTVEVPLVIFHSICVLSTGSLSGTTNKWRCSQHALYQMIHALRRV